VGNLPGDEPADPGTVPTELPGAWRERGRQKHKFSKKDIDF